MREHLFDDVEDIIGYILARNGYLGHSELHLILVKLYNEYECLYGNDERYPKHLFKRNNDGFMIISLPKSETDKYINRYIENDVAFIYLTEKYFKEYPEVEILINVITKNSLEID